jgi:hypothetical protein
MVLRRMMRAAHRLPFAERRDSFGDEARARALEWAAAQIETAIQADDDQRLTLSEAALRSGYSADHLARLLREGRLPNAGRPGSPRSRVADLPIRPGRPLADQRVTPMIPSPTLGPLEADGEETRWRLGTGDTSGAS